MSEAPRNKSVCPKFLRQERHEKMMREQREKSVERKVLKLESHEKMVQMQAAVKLRNAEEQKKVCDAAMKRYSENPATTSTGAGKHKHN